MENQQRLENQPVRWRLPADDSFHLSRRSRLPSLIGVLDFSLIVNLDFSLIGILDFSHIGAIDFSLIEGLDFSFINILEFSLIGGLDFSLIGGLDFSLTGWLDFFLDCVGIWNCQGFSFWHLIVDCRRIVFWFQTLMVRGLKRASWHCMALVSQMNTLNPPQPNCLKSWQGWEGRC